MKTNVIALDESQRAEYWADRIGKAHTASVEAIVNTGRELIAAKAKLAHGEWGRLTGRDGGNGLLPFSHQAAHRMMSVAGHSALSNVAHGRHLPPSWRTLAVLAQLPPPVIERHIYDGVLHPELTRADAEALVDEHKQAQQPRVTAPMWPTVEQATQEPKSEFKQPPPMTAERRAELDAAFDQAQQQYREAQRKADETAAAYRQHPAPQGAWAEVLGSIRAIESLAIELQASLENRMQPLPAPSVETVAQLCDRLANAEQQLDTLIAHIYSTYINGAANHAHH